jgi:hypothetical protein
MGCIADGEVESSLEVLADSFLLLLRYLYSLRCLCVRASMYNGRRHLLTV